jgi:hypothetical protein
MKKLLLSIVIILIINSCFKFEYIDLKIEITGKEAVIERSGCSTCTRYYIYANNDKYGEIIIRTSDYMEYRLFKVGQAYGIKVSIGGYGYGEGSELRIHNIKSPAMKEIRRIDK